MNTFQALFETYSRSTDTDISEHLTTLRRYADVCEHVTEMGVRHGISTVAFLSSAAKAVVSYDIREEPEVAMLRELCRQAERDWVFHLEDSRQCTIAETDLLFIDTYHYYEHLRTELDRHGASARKFIVMHDTEIYKYRSTEDRDDQRGLMTAIEEFLTSNPEWFMLEHFTNQYGLTILQRS